MILDDEKGNIFKKMEVKGSYLGKCYQSLIVGPLSMAPGASNPPYPILTTLSK